MELNPNSNFIQQRDSDLLRNLFRRAATVAELAQLTNIPEQEASDRVAFLIEIGYVESIGIDLQTRCEIYFVTEEGAHYVKTLENMLGVKERARSLLDRMAGETWRAHPPLTDPVMAAGAHTWKEYCERVDSHYDVHRDEILKQWDAAFLWACGIRVDDDLV